MRRNFFFYRYKSTFMHEGERNKLFRGIRELIAQRL